MKRKLSALALTFGWVAAALAQGPVNPDNTSAQAAQTIDAAAQPAQSPPPTTIPVEPPSLIPPNTLPGPDAASLPQPPGAADLQLLNSLFKQSSLGKTADEHRLHVQMATLKTQIRNDEGLHQLLATAEAARTDLEKRHRLKTYYQVYYKKLGALATTPELKAYLTAVEVNHELLLLQPKTRHETDEPAAAQLVQARAGVGATEETSVGLPTPTAAPIENTIAP